MITVVNIRDEGVRDALKAGDERYVYCGRAMPRMGLKASKWANPFKIGIDGGRFEVISKHRVWVLHKHDLMAALHELRDKILVCFCHPELCHCDSLKEFAGALLPASAIVADADAGRGER